MPLGRVGASGVFVYGGRKTRGCGATGRSRPGVMKKRGCASKVEVWSCMCVVYDMSRRSRRSISVLSDTCFSDSDTTPLRNKTKRPLRLKPFIAYKYFTMAVDPLTHSSYPTQVRVQLVDHETIRNASPSSPSKTPQRVYGV
jgi:hypothetical protein